MAKPKLAKESKSFNWGSLIKRSMSSLVLVSVAFGAIFFGSPYLEILILLIGVLLAWEWANMVPNKNVTFYLGAYVFAVASVIYSISWWVLGIVFLTAVWVRWKARANKEEHCKLLTLGVLYISLGVGSLAWLYQQFGSPVFVWLLLVVWGMDTGGYLIGCTVKGPKLFPKISPNKTYSGLFGGFLFAALFNCALIWFFDYNSRDAILTMVRPEEYLEELKRAYIVLSLVAVVFAFVAQIGDFIESAIKRYLGIKDSSNIIPGHGGVFDRVDGLIFAAPVMYVFIRLFYLFEIGL